MTVDTFDDDDDQDDATHVDEVEGGRYYSVYDGLTGFGPGGSGRSWAAKGSHPPLYCPNPRFQPNARGLYFCPCCGEKIRHHTYVSATEWAAETIDPALIQVWEIIWPSTRTLITWTARAIAWMARAAWNIVNRHRQEASSADMEQLPARHEPGIESQDASTEQSNPPAAAKQEDNQEDKGEIGCTTSDGIHVTTIKNGRDECLVCGTELARKAG